MEFSNMVDRYVEILEKEAKRMNMRVIILGDLDEEWYQEAKQEEGIALDQYIRDIPYAFVAPAANKVYERIQDACVGVLNKKGYVNTSSGPHFQRIFALELQKCDKMYKQKKYKKCGDALIGILIALKNWPHGWYDCENYDEAQKILDQFGELWENVMVNYSSNLPNLVNYISDPKQAKITAYFRKVKPKQNKKTKDKGSCDKYSKRVLYNLISEVNEGMKGMGYPDGFDFGAIPRDIVGINGHRKVDIDIASGNDEKSKNEKEDKNKNKKRKFDEIKNTDKTDTKNKKRKLK